jgi:hypothetical protein
MRDLSGELMIQGEIEKMLNTVSDERSVADILPDDPFTGLGIVGFADLDNEEVGLTFLFPNAPIDNSFPVTGRTARTFVFSERLKKFYGNYPFGEHAYFNIGSMLLSNHSYLDDSYRYVTNNKMYRYNVKSLAGGQSNYATFFGSIEQTQISFIVNGLSEKENTSELIKIFNAMEIEMADVKPTSIIFTTLYQSGTYDFSTTELWQISEYLEHKWHVPISLQTSPTEDAFQPDSEFRGAWLKVTLVFNTNRDVELKSILSDFDISFA